MNRSRTNNYNKLEIIITKNLDVNIDFDNLSERIFETIKEIGPHNKDSVFTYIGLEKDNKYVFVVEYYKDNVSIRDHTIINAFSFIKKDFNCEYVINNLNLKKIKERLIEFLNEEWRTVIYPKQLV